jgi:hypothetical protein
MYARVCFEFAQKVEKLDWVDYFSKRTTLPQQWMEFYPHVIQIHQLLCPNGKNLEVTQMMGSDPYDYVIVQVDHDFSNCKQFVIDKNGIILGDIVGHVPSSSLVVVREGTDLLFKMLQIVSKEEISSIHLSSTNTNYHYPPS